MGIFVVPQGPCHAADPKKNWKASSFEQKTLGEISVPGIDSVGVERQNPLVLVPSFGGFFTLHLH